MMPMFSPEDLFLRDSDRERLAMSYNALVTKRQSLLMLSENDVLLEHYGRMLIRMLRETSDVEVEVYFPSSTDALVQRFNDILAPLSVEDAMSILGPALPARVLVMHDAKSVKRQQVELLARLVNDFPGANVRLVMLLNESTERREDLASFGKRTARWTIETPTPVVADVFLQKAASVGMAGAATHLIDRLGLRQIDADTLAQDDEPADGLPYEAEVFGADDQASTAWGWRRWLMTLFVAVSLLILSAVLVLSLYPKHRDAVLDLIWPELAVNAGEATADIPADDGGALLKKDAAQPPAEVVQTEPSSLRLRQPCPNHHHHHQHPSAQSKSLPLRCALSPWHRCPVFCRLGRMCGPTCKYPESYAMSLSGRPKRNSCQTPASSGLTIDLQWWPCRPRRLWR